LHSSSTSKHSPAHWGSSKICVFANNWYTHALCLVANYTVFNYYAGFIKPHPYFLHRKHCINNVATGTLKQQCGLPTTCVKDTAHTHLLIRLY
jgi:hypothetical protein